MSAGSLVGNSRYGDKIMTDRIQQVSDQQTTLPLGRSVHGDRFGDRVGHPQALDAATNDYDLVCYLVSSSTKIAGVPQIPRGGLLRTHYHGQIIPPNTIGQL